MQTPHVTPLIPRARFFDNPDKAMLRLSHDGQKIAFLAPHAGVLNLWVAPAADPTRARPVTQDTGRGIPSYHWAYTHDHLLYIQDSNGDENWRVYSACLSSGAILDLTPIAGVHAQIQHMGPKFPRDILVALNDDVPEYHNLYRVDIINGSRQRLLDNKQFSHFVCDDDYRVRLGVRTAVDGGSELHIPTDAGQWRLLERFPPEDTRTSGALGFDGSGSLLYMLDSRGRDTAALVALDTVTGARTLLAADPQVDAGEVLWHPTERTAQALTFTYERRRWQALDASVAEDLKYLRSVAPGELLLLARTLDDRVWTVAFVPDDGPVRYYRYKRAPRHAQFLCIDRVGLEGLPLAQQHPRVIRARDGLNLVSYLSLPVVSHNKGSDRPSRPLPMVLWVHGGPSARDVWGYNAMHQWLTNRGYAVLSVNFRGSTGFGKAFLNAGNREWGGRMHEDLLDAVAWAVREGIADPARIAIAGVSYGGYAALAGLAFTPEVFACGIDVVGPSNLVTLLETMPAYWQPEVEEFARRIGDHRTAEGRALLTTRSPLTHAHRIQRPLLIGQGANDPRVKRAESDQIVHALEARQVPVTYILYPDEGHGFARPQNRMSFWAVAETFLATHLGGRCESFGDTFAGSSITVPVGADFIPGLATTLTRGGRQA